MTSIASLKNQLSQNPEHHHTKQQVLSLLAQVKRANTATPLDKYLLAQFYAPNSPKYKQLMREASSGGCLNAMLSMCELLLKSPSPADLKTAAHYMKMIEHSKDSFIKNQSSSLLKAHPNLASLMKGENKQDWSNSQSSFFFDKPIKTQSVNYEPRECFTK